MIVILISLVVTNIRIVPQARAYVIERLGAYKGTWQVGLHFKFFHSHLNISRRWNVLYFYTVDFYTPWVSRLIQHHSNFSVDVLTACQGFLSSIKFQENSKNKKKRRSNVWSGLFAKRGQAPATGTKAHR